MSIFFRSLIAVIVCAAVVPQPATAGPLTVNVRCSATVSGTISFDRAYEPKGGQGIEGEFKASTTLSAFEKCMGQDHLNWFQKVISVTPTPSGVQPKFVDPPSGGLGRQWNDNRPWYWDEFGSNSVPAGKDFVPDLQLHANETADDTLVFEDFPHGQSPGTVINFATFLISDYGNRTYSVLGSGFAWQATIQSDGKTSITSLTGDAQFTEDYKSEIKDEYPGGYSMVPEPGSVPMLAVGMIGLAVALGRRRAHRECV